MCRDDFPAYRLAALGRLVVEVRLDDLTNKIAADAVTVDVILPARLHAMRDAMTGQPGAQHFEPIRASRSTLWCWLHEREVTLCEREDLDCDGEAIDLHDPAGEAAVNNDPAKADHRALQRHLGTIARHLDAALKLLAKYEPQRPTIDRAGIGTCTDCHRYLDGQKGNRLSAYKGGDPVCPACRARRDRAADTPPQCTSELTRANVTHRCEREQDHTGMHRGDGWDWSDTQVVRSGAA